MRLKQKLAILATGVGGLAVGSLGLGFAHAQSASPAPAPSISTPATPSANQDAADNGTAEGPDGPEVGTANDGPGGPDVQSGAQDGPDTQDGPAGPAPAHK